ncbi:hypothetical protein JCM10512_3843 [Bacteroides reticulotermitis JCM 10512]|uniref:Uncharacterized protein n=1 Tax=Bacteroides reticulotermitis JCM 10512 TaxID=1445607 RepID=W4UXW6_9BACE|nr:hypothetical protein JCM10512_3843 [Bacteroides reticulotermitis JCM 10512]
MRNQQKHAAMLAITMLLVLSGCCRKDHNELLVIKEQGSFTVGGTVIQNSGSYDATQFDNFKPYPEGQTYHAIMPMCFIKYRIMPVHYLLSSFTARGNLQRHGKQRRMGEKVFRIFFFVRVSVPT